MAEKLMTIPLSNLRRSAANIRKTDASRDLEELVASIAAHGLLQNLTVRPVGANGKSRATDFEVVAGARRLAALKLLAKRKRIAKEFPVPCRVVADDDATELSLAENVVRTPLHPADQFDAFAKLQNQGLGIEDIAARFGIAATTVRQRLKLAVVSPRIMAVYRSGEMTLDQLVAFTLTDDHEAQERVWFDGASGDQHPQTLRRMLTRTLVEGSDRRARFIGAEAYEAAGGTIIRDLFRVDDDGYFTDSQLLDRLVAEKLAAEAEKVKAENWSWVEAMTEVDYGYLSRFRRVQPTEVELSARDEKKLSKCCQRHDELITDLEDDAPAEVVAELDRVTAEITTLSARKEQWTEEDKAVSGAVVSLDYHGNVGIVRGLASEERSETRDRHKTGKPGSTEAGAGQSPSDGAVSDRLLEDLSAHRTAALRVVLAGEPRTALMALLHVLVSRTFFGFIGETCVDIRVNIVDLRPSAEGIGESKAVAALAARHQGWLDRLADPDQLWSWLGQQTDETLLELLAYCVAVSVNAVRRKSDGYMRERFDQADLLAEATNLDMADWWEPTGERYLNRVSKARIMAAASEAVSPQAAENLRQMKKDAMASRAEELLAGKRWLPEALRPSDGSVTDAA